MSGTNQNKWHRNIVNGRRDSLPQIEVENPEGDSKKTLRR